MPLVGQITVQTAVEESSLAFYVPEMHGKHQSVIITLTNKYQGLGVEEE